MRRLFTLSAALLGLALSNNATAAAPPRLVTHTGPFTASVAGAKGQQKAASALDKEARALIEEKAPARVTALALGASSEVALKGGDRVVRVRQTHKGLPVVFGGASVLFGADGAARMVVTKLVDDLPEDVTPLVSAIDAAKTASKVARLEVDPAKASLVVWTLADASFLAWVVKPAVIPGLPYEPVVVVDAKSGDAVLRFNNAVHAIPKGNVYATNPEKSPNLIAVDLQLADGAPLLENARVESLNCVDKKTTKNVDIGLGQPIPVHLCELEQTAAPDMNGDFLIPAAGDKEPEDPFSQVQMFYHTNRAYDYFLGFDANFDANPMDAAPLPAVSNLRIPDASNPLNIGNTSIPLVPFQNAFFSPGDQLFGQAFGTTGPAMYFGQGPSRDYGYDGDVVYHEFGHAMINATLQLVPIPHLDKYGASVSNGGMNEGLADYFSAAISGDPDVGEYVAKDINASMPYIRSIASPDKCPTAIGGEVHQDATLFSGGLWDVRVKLPAADADKFDLALYTALATVPPPADMGYEELADVLIKSVEASLGKAVADDLTAAFTARGVLPMCTRILEHTGKTLTGPKELSNLWFAIGTAGLDMSNKLSGDYAPGVVQMHYAIPADAGELTVAFERVEVGGGLGGLGGGGTPFTPQVLVRFGADPITFSDFTPIKPDGETTLVEPTEDSDVFTATFAVPAGATEVHFMVVNTGQSDGAYTNMDVTAIKAPEPGAGGAGGSGPASSSSSGGTNNGIVDEDSGCGCAVPGAADGRGALAVVAAAGLALSILRRRQARRSSKQ